MPVKRRKSKRREPVPDWVYEYFETGDQPGDGDGRFDHFLLHGAILRYPRPDSTRPKYWDDIREELVSDYVRKHPGTRPWAWWAMDAPEPELVDQGEDLEPVSFMRRQVGGTGALDGLSRCSFGIPYGIDHCNPPLPNDDPPMYESQAAYLRRHGLLSATEKRKLRKKDFEPEVIEIDPDELAEIWEFLEWEKKEAKKKTSTPQDAA